MNNLTVMVVMFYFDSKNKKVSIKAALIQFMFITQSGDIIIGLVIHKSVFKTGQSLGWNMSICLTLILKSGFTQALVEISWWTFPVGV